MEEAEGRDARRDWRRINRSWFCGGMREKR